MKHIKNINEFNNYTEDSAKNVPLNLLNIGDEDDVVQDNGFASELLSLKPNLKELVRDLMDLYQDDKNEEIAEILDELPDDDRENVINALSRYGEFLSDLADSYNKNKVRNN